MPTSSIETAATLADIWKRVLKQPTVAVADNFLDCGGNSLAAQRMIGYILDAFGVEVTMSDLLGDYMPERDEDPAADRRGSARRQRPVRGGVRRVSRPTEME